MQTVLNLSYNKKELIRSLTSTIFYLLLVVSLFYTKFLGFLFIYIFLLIGLIKKNYNYELPLIFILIIATNVLEFGSVEQLPFLQLGAGLRFNILDIFVITYLIFFFNKILITKTPSSWIIKYTFWLTVIYIFIGFLIYLNPREAGTNYGRVLIYITSYFIFYFYFENLDNIKKILLLLSMIVIIGTVIHLAEYFINLRFELPGVIPFSGYYSTEGEKITTAGQERIYLWSRITGIIFIMTAFGLSIYLKFKKKLFLLIFIFSVLGFLIALSRIWFLGIALIILTILIIEETKNKLKVLIPALLLFIFVLLIQNFSVQLIGFDLLAAITGRAKSAVTLGRTYGEMDTFSVRVLMFNFNYNKFLESPLFGHGFGSSIWNMYYNVDLGLINRLVLLGLLGTIPLIIFLFDYCLKLIKKIKSDIPRAEKSILVSILAILVGHFPMYLWQIDFWGSNYIFFLTMLLAMGDRILMNNFNLRNSKNA